MKTEKPESSQRTAQRISGVIHYPREYPPGAAKYFAAEKLHACLWPDRPHTRVGAYSPLRSPERISPLRHAPMSHVSDKKIHWLIQATHLLEARELGRAATFLPRPELPRGLDSLTWRASLAYPSTRTRLGKCNEGCAAGSPLWPAHHARRLGAQDLCGASPTAQNL